MEPYKSLDRSSDCSTKVLWCESEKLGPRNTRSAKVWSMSVNAPEKEYSYVVRDPIWIGIPNALSTKKSDFPTCKPKT